MLSYIEDSDFFRGAGVAVLLAALRAGEGRLAVIGQVEGIG